MPSITQKDMDAHPGMLVTQLAHQGAENADAIHNVIRRYLSEKKNGQSMTYDAQQIKEGLKKADDELGRPELFEVIEHLIR